jgi:thiol-disulfide isomerase/thioredoxin
MAARRTSFLASQLFAPRLSSTTQVWSNQWMQKAIAFLSALFVASVAFAQPVASRVDLGCRWSAQLTAARPGVSESYVVPFDLSIEYTPAGMRAALVNGSDRMEFSGASQRGGVVTLRLDQYDATLTARCVSGTELNCAKSSSEKCVHPVCSALEGEYERQRGTSVASYKVVAQCVHVRQLDSEAVPQFSAAADWQFAFKDADGKPVSEGNVPAHFTQEARHVEGTIAPLSGDYGMLSGKISGGKDTSLHLSRFDGIHTLRLDGRFVSANRIEGIFQGSPGRPMNFVATRLDSSAKGFDEAEHLTTVEDPSAVFRFHGLDADGKSVTQDDPRFAGKVVLIDIFGTWCPNCHDEAPVLQSLYAKFHERGFEIAGLSYEYVDDTARSQRLLEVYRRKYAIGFPLLLAGTTEPGEIERTLPQLKNFGAYPTTIFLDRHGRVRLIHAGFSGPATGRLEEIKENFERNVVKLLDEQ